MKSDNRIKTGNVVSDRIPVLIHLTDRMTVYNRIFESGLRVGWDGTRKSSDVTPCLLKRVFKFKLPFMTFLFYNLSFPLFIPV
jgi:hypothetical protein